MGSTLEHVVLWWSSAPLACRPAACAKHLRDWLLVIQPEGIHFVSVDFVSILYKIYIDKEKYIFDIKICVYIFICLDAPEPILSTLRGLGETLTVYVAGTTWDQQFRLALVSGAQPVHKSFENPEFYCSTNDQVSPYLVAFVVNWLYYLSARKTERKLVVSGVSCYSHWPLFVTVAIVMVRFRMSCQSSNRFQFSIDWVRTYYYIYSMRSAY